MDCCSEINMRIMRDKLLLRRRENNRNHRQLENDEQLDEQRSRRRRWLNETPQQRHNYVTGFAKTRHNDARTEIQFAAFSDPVNS